ncbi:uncharacterized protein [Euphorbia lathyris]|uniref:uncharacterized protein n=1 Tax=Euphorbia lathyris TaxID=212925 RepID=UPI0033131948
MESSETNTNFDLWSSATNWIVAGGSIRNSITFESSLSLINDDHSTVNSIAKSPLILYSPSPNSTPCEITVTFAQKHEVQQIYIRSTARIYEIYYVSELGSSEYLCTVRCGIATRDEEVLHATDIEDVVCAHQKGSTKELTQEKERNGSSLTTNEDDWVEVKLLGTSLVVNGNSSLSSNTKTYEGTMSQKQDLFEATAEITDANPCMSITLRLLSLQNKSCVCIDELYVFGDPVDAPDLDKKAGPMENAAGSSLMAMLMPTFLELSKTKSYSQAQDKHDINRMARQNSVAIEEKPSDPVDAEKIKLAGGKTGAAYDDGVQLQEAVTPIPKTVELETPPQVSDTESKHDIPHNHIEGVLNQLVSRVNRIEDVFLRFENSMLNPIRSIDERLQRMEQNLEVLTKKTQNTGSLSCTRISAPEFSCSESETNSLYNSGCVDLGDAASDANKKDLVSAAPSLPSNLNPASVNATETLPNLVFTVPEFSNGDDGEEYDAVKPVEESPKEKQMNALPIDDALASALARLISSTSVQSPKYSKVLVVKAPEFPNEEGNNNAKTAPTGHCKISTEPPTCYSEFEETECVVNSFASLSISSSVDTDEMETSSLNQNNCMGMGEGVDEQLWNIESGQVTEKVEVDNETSKTTELDKFFGDQIGDGSDNFAASNGFVPNTEITEERYEPNILENVGEFPKAAFKVDFEIPILEVKFTSEKNLDVKSPLEALLAGISDLKDEDNSAKEQNKDSSESEDHQCNLIQVEDCGATAYATNVDTSIDAESALPLNAESIMHLI